MSARLIALGLGLSVFFTPLSVMAKGTIPEKTSNIILLSNKKQSPKITKLLNNVEKILDGVAGARELALKNKVSVGVKSPEELNQFLQTMFTKEYSEKDMKKDYLLLERLGLIKKNTNLKDTFLNLYTEQIAGFYDNDTRSLYLIENPKFGGLEFSIIISHELVHALQDQNFNLKKVLESDKSNDATLARTALIEGEAMVASMQYQVKSFSADLSTLGDISNLLKGSLFGSGAGMEALKKTPGFLVEQMTFPYVEGMKFVQSLYDDAGNWEQFNQVYKKLPTSTEQILHPDKYKQNEQPLKVDLDESFISDKSWKFLQKDSMGEFFIMNYFLEYLDEETAKKAAAGWGGDSCLLYSKGEDDSLFVFKTLWDSEKDAAEFFTSYTKSLEERYGTKLKVKSQSLNKFSADTPQGKVYLVLNQNSVNIAEGFSQEMNDQIINSLK